MQAYIKEMLAAKGLTQKEIFSRFTQLNFRSQFIEAANKDFAK